MRKKTEILYGIHPVFEALKAGKRFFFELYVAKEKISKRINKVVEAAEKLDVPVKKVQAAQLSSMAGSDHHQGIGALASPYPLGGGC